MVRLALFAWFCLQQMPLARSDEVVLMPSAAAAVQQSSASQGANVSQVEQHNHQLVMDDSTSQLSRAINITYINGTAYEEYEVPESGNMSFALGQQEGELAVGVSSNILMNVASQTTFNANRTVDAGTTTASTPSSTTTPGSVTVISTPSTVFESTMASTLATVKVELGRLTLHPAPPVIDDSGSLELFCSVGYHDSATIVWTLNDQPLEDIVLRSVISGRKDFFLKSLRVQVERLETLPANGGKYVFECSASVDGNLVKEKVVIDSPYSNFCKNDSECSVRNGVCENGLLCRCDESHPVQLNSSHLTCRAAAQLGWPCSYNEQCLHSANRSQCGSKGECTCLESYKMETSPQGTTACIPLRTINAPCTSHDDCSEIGAMCSLTFTCQCPAGTLENSGRCMGSQRAVESSSGKDVSAGSKDISPGTNATATSISSGYAGDTNLTVGVKKSMPVRILKVREFPRGGSVKAKNETDLHSASLEGLVKVDIPGHENDTVLGNQRMLTGASLHLLALPHFVGFLSMVASFPCLFYSSHLLL